MWLGSPTAAPKASQNSAFPKKDMRKDLADQWGRQCGGDKQGDRFH